jgi:hypothetical protein
MERGSRMPARRAAKGIPTARGCGTLPGLRRGRPEFSVSRSSAIGLIGVQRGGRPFRGSLRISLDETSEAGDAPRRDALGKRFVPTRPTGDGRSQSSSCATFRVTRLSRCPNPVPPARWKPMPQPAAIGTRDAALFSAFLLEAPGSGRTPRTVIRRAASLTSSARAARGHAHSCRHSTSHPNRVTRLLADRARPRPPCATRRDTRSTYTRRSPESIGFECSPSFPLTER